MKSHRSAGVILSVVAAMLLGAGMSAQAGVGEAEAFENRLNTALQEMLDAVVGPGRAVVTTAAELDLDRVETVRKTYTVDPSVGALSEKLSSQSSPGGVSTSVVRANALNSVQETRVNVPGEIEKLSIAVLVDEAAAESIDLDQLQMLLSTAAGVDVGRGDVVTVAAMPMHEPAAEPQAATANPGPDRRGLYAGVGLVVVLLLVLLALSARRRSRKRAEAERRHAALDAARPVVATATVDRRHMISQATAGDPQRAADILRGWADRGD